MLLLCIYIFVFLYDDMCMKLIVYEIDCLTYVLCLYVTKLTVSQLNIVS